MRDRGKGGNGFKPRTQARAGTVNCRRFPQTAELFEINGKGAPIYEASEIASLRLTEETALEYLRVSARPLSMKAHHSRFCTSQKSLMANVFLCDLRYVFSDRPGLKISY
jgi:hypothetical protein